MASNSCTFIIIPDAASQCKRYNIPKSMLYAVGISGVIFLIVLGGILYVLLNNYGIMSMKVKQLEKLKHISASQKNTIDRYEQDITQLSKHLSQIKQLNSRLMILTGLDPAKGKSVLGIGGSEELDVQNSKSAAQE
jgi:hypothetical protein